MLSTIKNNSLYLTILVLISYPFLYYNYKFGNPALGLIDFFDYFPMYHNWDFSEVESPFNTRIISITLVYLLVQIGIYYPTKISFTHADIDQETLQLVFFNANLVSYIGVLFTCYFLKKIIFHETKNELFSSTLSFLYLVGFATISLMVSGLTDSWGVLFGTIAFYLFIKRCNWIFLVLFLSIFQREYVFFIFGLLGLFYGIKSYNIDKKINSYPIRVMIGSILFFIIYFVLRKTLFFTEEHASQLETTGYLSNLLTKRFPFWDYVFQTFFIQNIVMLYVLVLIYKWRKKMEINKEGILLVSLLFLMVIAVSFIAALGNSAGRYFHINIAVVFFFLAKELYPILHHKLSLSKE
jgi:hypothetical protein